MEHQPIPAESTPASQRSIPKIIHYCWFGGAPLPELAERCIASWQRFCPDYQILRWDESSFDVDQCRYTHTMYQAKRWAFLSDYARFQILYQHGGVYLDTDVELLRGLDPLVEQGPFMGIQAAAVPEVAPGLGMAAEPGNPFLQEMLAYYNAMPPAQYPGQSIGATVVDHTTARMQQYGFLPEDRMQYAAGFSLYPSDVLCPMNYLTGALHCTDQTYAIHHYMASWLTRRERTWLHWEQQLQGRFGTDTLLTHNRVWNLARDLYRYGLAASVRQAFQRLRPPRG